MKITDQSSSLYSKYITNIYQSVAYFDEPLFLKMQELIKLILAVEWLNNEKGVRVSKKWIEQHTQQQIERGTGSKKPPYEMIPKPSVFSRPSSDVTVKTWDAELYRHLKTSCGVERRYGYYDFGRAEVFMFKEDGTPCLVQKCIKVFIEHKSTLDGTPCVTARAWFYITKQDDFKDELVKRCILPKDSHTEICPAVDTENGMVKRTFQPCPQLLPTLEETTIATATIDNYNKLYASEDPNSPIRPKIPEVCEAVVPNVKSWDELFSELSVPFPRMWQVPFIGIGEPTAAGGVSTREFHVEREPLQNKQALEGIQQEGIFKRSGQLLAVQANRAPHITAQGAIQLVHDANKFADVSSKFSNSWVKGACPHVTSIFSITNSTLEKEWKAYRRTLRSKGREEYYHGTTLVCGIAATQTLCRNGNCGICGITCAGLDPRYIRENMRFGKGFYLAPNSSKSDVYTQGANGYTAMLLCDVLPGEKFPLDENHQSLTGPPEGYNSISGIVGEELDYPEIVVYDPRAVMPRYIIVYKKD